MLLFWWLRLVVEFGLIEATVVVVVLLSLTAVAAFTMNKWIQIQLNTDKNIEMKNND